MTAVQNVPQVETANSRRPVVELSKINLERQQLRGTQTHQQIIANNTN